MKAAMVVKWTTTVPGREKSALAVPGQGKTFWVRGAQGPLCDGEEERARWWGRWLASR